MKKHTFARFYTLLSVMVLAITMAVTTSAVSIVDQGTCGDPAVNNGENVTWVLDNLGTLTISGTGEMENYVTGWSEWVPIPDRSSLLATARPWDSHANEIFRVVIKEGVTSIGEAAFYSTETSKFTEIVLPKSLKTIGEEAFYDYCKLDTVCYGGTEAEWSAITRLGVGNSCLDNATKNYLGNGPVYSFDAGGVITVHAYGEMPNYATASQRPWHDSCAAVKGIVVCYCADSVGSKAFYGCSAATSVTLPGKVMEIGSGAFNGCNALTDVYFESDKTTFDTCTVGSSNAPLKNADKHYYTVYTYNTGKGTSISETRAYALTSFKTTTRSGKIFAGWYDNSSYTGEPISLPFAAENDTTLYAKWVSATLSVNNLDYDSTLGTYNLKFDVSADITTGGSFGGTLVLGLYDKDGRLMSTHLKAVNSKEPVQTIEYALSLVKSPVSYKLFLAYGMTQKTFIPLALSISGNF